MMMITLSIREIHHRWQIGQVSDCRGVWYNLTPPPEFPFHMVDTQTKFPRFFGPDLAQRIMHNPKPQCQVTRAFPQQVKCLEMLHAIAT